MSDESLEIDSSTSNLQSETNSQVDRNDNFVTKEEMNEKIQARTSYVRKKALQEGYEKAVSDLKQKDTSYLPDNFNTLSKDEVNRLIDERARQAEDKIKQEKDAEVLKDAIDSFHQKMAPGKEEYPDFDEAIGTLQLTSIPSIALLASRFENTADIMYELAKHPSKIGTIYPLVKEGTLHLAYAAMDKISKSIKKNKEALKTKSSSNSPLSQMKPSSTYTDSGAMTSSDWKNKYKGKG